METTTTKVNMGEYSLSTDNVCVWDDNIDGRNYHSILKSCQFPTYNDKKMHLTFPFELHKVALKKPIFDLDGRSEKKKTVPSHKVNPLTLNLTQKFLPTSHCWRTSYYVIFCRSLLWDLPPKYLVYCTYSVSNLVGLCNLTEKKISKI